MFCFVLLCDRDLMLSEGDFLCNNLSQLTVIVAYLKFLGNLIGILLVLSSCWNYFHPIPTPFVLAQLVYN